MNSNRIISINILLILVVIVLLGYTLYLHIGYYSYFAKDIKEYTWSMDTQFEIYDRDEAILVTNHNDFNITPVGWGLRIEQNLGHESFNDLLLSSSTDSMHFQWYSFQENKFFQIILPLNKLRKLADKGLTKAYLSSKFSYGAKPRQIERLKKGAPLLKFEMSGNGILTIELSYGPVWAEIFRQTAKEMSWYILCPDFVIQTYDDWQRLVNRKYNWSFQTSDSLINKSRNINAYFYKPNTFHRYSKFGGYSLDLTQPQSMPAPLLIHFYDKARETQNVIKMNDEILTIMDELSFTPPFIIHTDNAETVDIEEKAEEPILLYFDLAGDPQHRRLIATRGEKKREIPIKYTQISVSYNE